MGAKKFTVNITQESQRNKPLNNSGTNALRLVPIDIRTLHRLYTR
jgi:hypothetical protein